MNEAIDRSAGRGQGECSSRVDATGLKVPPFTPIADLRSTVKDERDSGRRGRTSRRIGQVTAHNLDIERVEEIGRAPGANQGANPITPSRQPFGQMTPQ